VHLANSAAVLGTPDAWCDAVRPGLALYGIGPAGAGAPLTPAMTIETRVVSARRVPAGTPLGYGGRFVTARPTTVAVLPIGYHDGFRRGFSGKVPVVLRGKAAPVVGAVSMDVTLVDATDCGAERGDRVVCLGSDGGASVTVWDLARAAGNDSLRDPLRHRASRAARVPRTGASLIRASSSGSAGRSFGSWRISAASSRCSAPC
jgi:alanine racemase